MENELCYVEAIQEEITVIEAEVAAIIATLNLDENPKVHQTRNGLHYATMVAIAEILGVSVSPIKKRKNYIQEKSPRRRNGKRLDQGPTYCIEGYLTDPDIRAKINNKIRVADDGYYRDEEGDWCSAETFYNSLPLEERDKTSETAILRLGRSKKCRSKLGVGKNGVPNTQIFLVSDLKEKIMMGHINSDVQVNPETGYYEAPDRMKWATAKMWTRKMEVTERALNKGVEKNPGSFEKMKRIRGKCSAKREEWLYPENEIRAALAYIFDAEYQLRDDGKIYELTNGGRKVIEEKYLGTEDITKETELTKSPVLRKLASRGCKKIHTVHRRTGEERNFYKWADAKEIFKKELVAKIETDEDGECSDPRYGRAITLARFYESNLRFRNNPKLRIIFMRHIRASGHTRLKRVDARNGKRVTLHFESDLKRIAQVALAEFDQ